MFEVHSTAIKYRTRFARGYVCISKQKTYLLLGTVSYSDFLDKTLYNCNGRSLTIPCHYEPQYASYVKYWCRGRMKDFCTSMARTDEPRTPEMSAQKVMIYDDPVQLVFSITMTQLKEEDSGWYMCGVEIGGIWSADLVLSAGMSVLHSRLIGEEGSSVTAECFYSEKYRESPKKWCRSGDWSSCLLTDSEGAYTDATVDIQDDRSGAFAVTYKRLQMRHTGWYWCGAGQQKVAVHLQVLPRVTTSKSSVVMDSSVIGV
uniref:Immunoglobulin domain-containing protein n=1 Tax=Periophthalmus magnuspinnatus TaxID=409849 RepID=A0A3B4B8H4_9GOBI